MTAYITFCRCWERKTTLRIWVNLILNKLNRWENKKLYSEKSFSDKTKLRTKEKIKISFFRLPYQIIIM